jgi:HPt (histidine-containing phosphotransfer) domain-containing protein
MDNSIIDRTTYTLLQETVGNEFLAELVASYLDDTPLQITKLREALTAGDVDAFRRAAHSIKSTSLNFGALQFAEQARRLEYLGRDSRLEAVGSGLDDLAATFSIVQNELMMLEHE